MSPEGEDIACKIYLVDRGGAVVDGENKDVWGREVTGRFTETLRFRDRCDVIAIPRFPDFRSKRVRIENPEGLRRIREEIIIDPSASPVHGVLMGCDGAPVNTWTDGGLAELYARPGSGGQSPVDMDDTKIELDERTPGSFAIWNAPVEPFVLHAHCPGYLPAVFQLDPARLPDPLVLTLDCSETFCGRIEPPEPRDYRFPESHGQRWSIETEGKDLQSNRWCTDANGNFTVHGKDLRKVTLRIGGMGFEDLTFDLSRPTSPEDPAVLRPVAIPNARVEVTVEDGTAFPAGATVSLQPIRRQDWSNTLASHERELTGAKAIFEDVLPARYDVVVSRPDGEELARLQDRSIRGPDASIHVRLPSRLLMIEPKGTAAAGNDSLVIRLDGDIEGQPLPCKDGTAEITALPGWYLVEFGLGKEEVIYRGRLRLREDQPLVLDLSRLITLEVTRNSADAPLALSMNIWSHEDDSQQAKGTFPLPDRPGKSVFRWLLEPSTHLEFINQFGAYEADFREARKLDIRVGLLETLRVPISEEKSVRTFLLGKVPGQAMVYWYGCSRPVVPGSVFEVPLECELSDWALLLYDGRVQCGAIANGVSLERRSITVRVDRADGSPFPGAEVSIRGKEIIGLDLSRYFRSPLLLLHPRNRDDRCGGKGGDDGLRLPGHGPESHSRRHDGARRCPAWPVGDPRAGGRGARLGAWPLRFHGRAESDLLSAGTPNGAPRSLPFPTSWSSI